MVRNTLAIAFAGFVMMLGTSATASARAISRTTGEACPQIARTSVDAFGKDSFHITFKGGERARVEITGDGSSKLDVYVYDENGNLVIHQPGFNPWVEFNVNYTSSFHVVVRNPGAYSNSYVLRTN